MVFPLFFSSDVNVVTFCLGANYDMFSDQNSFKNEDLGLDLALLGPDLGQHITYMHTHTGRKTVSRRG